MPRDAFSLCPKCGLEWITHKITEYGAALHPLSGLDNRFNGKICEEIDG